MKYLIYLLIAFTLCTFSKSYQNINDETFFNDLEILKKEFSTENFGIEKIFSKPFFTFDLALKKQGRLHVVDNIENDHSSYQCSESAIRAFQYFYNKGYEVYFIKGKDQFSIWEKHFYNKVHVAEKIFTVDFTPLYFKLMNKNNIEKIQHIDSEYYDTNDMYQYRTVNITLDEDYIPYKYIDNEKTKKIVSILFYDFYPDTENMEIQVQIRSLNKNDNKFNTTDRLIYSYLFPLDWKKIESIKGSSKRSFLKNHRKNFLNIMNENISNDLIKTKKCYYDEYEIYGCEDNRQGINKDNSLAKKAAAKLYFYIVDSFL